MKLKFVIYLSIFFVLSLFTVNLYLNISYKNKILPNTFINGIQIGGLTEDEALDKVKILAPINKTIVLSTNQKDYVFNSNYFKFDYDMEETIRDAYLLGREGNFFNKLKDKFLSVTTNRNIEFVYEYDNSLIDVEISRIVGEEKISGNEASFVYKSGYLDILPEKTGISVDYPKLIAQLQDKINGNQDIYVKIPFKKRSPEITSKDLLSIQNDISKKFLSSFRLNFFEKNRTLYSNEVFSLIKIRKNKDGLYYDLNEELLKKLTFEIREIVDNKPRARVTKFENDKVLEFNINQEGSVLDEARFRKDFRSKLFAGERSLDLPSIKIGSNFSKESYGITNLLGVGRSKFVGSITSRVHNLNLAAEKINGTLVAPGEEFSFLNTVGPISSTTGFQTAYVISQGRTVLGEGGGVCQTSTTLFRAILNSGLPITARYPHAYRVGYYEQDAKPGFDASVYFPSLDLKFKNDTDRYVLIQAEVDKKNYEMVFYLFGTKDGRQVSITDPQLFGYIPTPAPEYVEDSSLKPGQVKQIDFPASGITSTFERTVTKNGEELYKDSFRSTYSPWKAIYLKGPSKKKD
jgi:vancomycin resistance protein YoaR